MTDKEKLQRLFDAALKDPTELKPVPPKRAFPVTSLDAVPVPAAIHPAPVMTSQPMPQAPVAVLQTDPAPQPTTPPTMAAVLDDAASTELAALLDEQQRRKKRKHRMEALVTALVLLGLTGGGSAWFVSSPDRVQAFKDAIREVRSVGDVKSLVAKYQKALDRIGARGQQIDQATAAMGVKKSAKDDEDPFMEAEMKQMMGGADKGKTVGERNRLLKQNFGHMEKKHGVDLKATAKVSSEESFDWK